MPVTGAPGSTGAASPYAAHTRRSRAGLPVRYSQSGTWSSRSLRSNAWRPATRAGLATMAISSTWRELTANPCASSNEVNAPTHAENAPGCGVRAIAAVRPVSHVAPRTAKISTAMTS